MKFLISIMHSMKYWLLLILMLFWVNILFAQNRREVSIDFRVDTSSIEPAYSNNADRLANIIVHLQSVFADSTLKITSVEFSGMASPDGDTDVNHRLSCQRMQVLQQYICSHVSIPDTVISYHDQYVSWQYLDSVVVNSDMEYRSEVSHIINNTPIYIFKNDKIVDGRKKQLMDFNYGRTWHEMDRRFFPAMRNACAVIVTYERVVAKEEEAIVEDSVIIEEPLVVADSVVMELPIVELAESPIYISLKTNALLDVVAIPSIGFEVYLGKKWSLATNWHYSWWKSDPKSWYWRTYGGDVALRRWFGSKAAEKPLTGHHVGGYAQILTYDFETGGRGYLGDRWSYAAGIEYGYSLPIAKRLNIDFTLGVGYLSGEYKEYLPMDDCYVWQATKNRHWVGPTKVEVSIVWLIGNGNTNKGKGGKR